MLFKRLFLAALAGAFGISALTADVSQLPTCSVNGVTYHYYDVAPKETVYSLCRSLGVSKDELIKYNPSVADGLKAGARLYFPTSQVAQSEAAPQGERIVTHHVQRGETIFGIANRYGVTTQSLLDANPILRDGLKAGQNITVKIPATQASTTRISTPDDAVAAAAVTRVQSATPSAYVVGKKETLYSIARAHDITVHELEEVNPGLTVIKEGQILNLPPNASVSKNPPAPQDATPAPIPSLAAGSHATAVRVDGPDTAVVATAVALDSVAVLPADAAEEPEKRVRDRSSVALMLPFMLEETPPGKTAQRYTEFYKGFLLAVDSLRASGRPITIGAYDTGGSLDKTREILARPELKEYAAIIAPDEAGCLATVANFGQANDIAVINVFAPRDELYLSNSMMYQSHLPTPDMLDKAAEALADRLSYSSPVFVTLKDVAPDKADFVARLKQALDAKQIAYQDIEVSGRLNPADLEGLKVTGNYTFIPSSSRQTDLNKIMPGLLEWQDKAITPIVKLMGYPEWITFRGETLANMHKLNTVVYTRFFADDDAKRTRDIDAKFSRWYGGEMESTIPRHGLLGFDMGMFLLGHLDSLREGAYDGVQNGFAFRNADGGRGAVNTVLYLVNFRPGGETEKIKL